MIEKVRLNIAGMSCASCVANVQRALSRVKGVESAEVFLLTNSAKVEFDSNVCNIESLIKAVQGVGYDASFDSVLSEDSMESKNHVIASVSEAIQNNTNQKTNNIDCHDFANAKSRNDDNKDSINSQNIESKEQKVKPTCALPKDYYTKRNGLKEILDYIEIKILSPKVRLILSVILSIIILYITMFAEMLNFPLPNILQQASINALTQCFIALCVMHLGRDFYFKGIKALFFLAPNMDSLVALGSLAGFFYSLYVLILGLIQNHINVHNLYFEGVCVILTFVMLGKFIENNAKNKAMANAKKLLQKQDSKVYKLQNLDSKERLEISLDSIIKGDYLEILEHSFVPVDCVLITPNNASIDESVLSGESLPINKQKGEIINAGSLNLESNIVVQALSGVKDSTLSKMKALIMDSLESKARIAALADKISGIFVPCVILLALLSGAFWLYNSGLSAGISYFASTLLISCPCALGLATPMAILFANARANNMGIFFKDSKSLENIATCDYAIFDKTGTLTSRDFKVVSINCHVERSETSNLVDTSPKAQYDDEILRLIASCEKSSTHILAQSICKAYTKDNLYNIIESKNIINRGIHAVLNVDSKPSDFIVGNATFMQENGVSVITKKSEVIHNIESNHTNMDCHADKSSRNDGLNIYIAKLDSNKYTLLGSITLQENLREDAKELIESLKQLGINSEILSGDNTQNVERVAKILNMDYKGNCSPNDKLERIKELQKQGKRVIMIGDGTNDAMALSRANVSIVMSSGANLSLEVGDIIYFNNHLGGIKNAVLLGRKALRNIKENLSFAFIYNAICIPIAMGIFSSFGIYLNPMLASLAMSLSSISVVSNATRLYYTKL